MDIDLDAVWKELGYRSKRTVIQKLERSYTEGEDYTRADAQEGSIIGRPPAKVFLSKNCYESLNRNKAIDGDRKAHLKALQAKYGGTMYRPCEFGVIDLLTDTEIIVLESGHNWLRGLGKLGAFVFAMPNDYKLRLALYDCNSNELKLAMKYKQANPQVEIEFLQNTKIGDFI